MYLYSYVHICYYNQGNVVEYEIELFFLFLQLTLLHGDSTKQNIEKEECLANGK